MAGIIQDMEGGSDMPGSKEGFIPGAINRIDKPETPVKVREWGGGGPAPDTNNSERSEDYSSLSYEALRLKMHKETNDKKLEEMREEKYKRFVEAVNLTGIDARQRFWEDRMVTALRISTIDTFDSNLQSLAAIQDDEASALSEYRNNPRLNGVIFNVFREEIEAVRLGVYISLPENQKKVRTVKDPEKNLEELNRYRLGLYSVRQPGGYLDEELGEEELRDIYGRQFPGAEVAYRRRIAEKKFAEEQQKRAEALKAENAIQAEEQRRHELELAKLRTNGGGNGDKNPMTEDRIKRAQEFREAFENINEFFGDVPYEHVPRRGTGEAIYEHMDESEAKFLEARLLIYNARAKIQKTTGVDEAKQIEELKALTKEQLKILTSYGRVSETVAIYTALAARPDLMSHLSSGMSETCLQKMGLWDREFATQDHIGRIDVKFLSLKDLEKVKEFRNRIVKYLARRFGLSEEEASLSEKIGYNFYRATRLPEYVNTPFNEQYKHDSLSRLGALVSYGNRVMMSPSEEIFVNEELKKWPRNDVGDLMWTIRRQIIYPIINYEEQRLRRKLTEGETEILLKNVNQLPFWQKRPLMESYFSKMEFDGQVLLPTDGMGNIRTDAPLIQIAIDLINGRRNNFKIDWDKAKDQEVPMFNHEFRLVKWAQFIGAALDAGEVPGDQGIAIANLERAFQDLGSVELPARKLLLALVYRRTERQRIRISGQQITWGNFGSIGERAAIDHERNKYNPNYFTAGLPKS